MNGRATIPAKASFRSAPPAMQVSVSIARTKGDPATDSLKREGGYYDCPVLYISKRTMQNTLLVRAVDR